MYRNVAAKFALFAFDTTTGAAKTGDAANLTAYVSKDYGSPTVLADTSATEMDATNAKGWYLFDAAQGETDAVTLLVTGKSTTANISVVGRVIETTPNRFTALVIDAAGLADANTVKVGPTGSGTAQTAGDIPARLPSALVGGKMDSHVNDIAAGAITATSIAADAITAAKVAADVTTELQTGLATSSALATAQSDLDDIQTRLPASLVGGRIDASVGAMAAGTITASAIAADAITAAKIADGAIDAATFAAGAINAAAIAADAITDAKVAADVTIASVTGAVGSVSGNVGGNVGGSVGSVAGNVDGNVGGSVASIGAGGITAASIAADAITAAKVAADVTTELQAGLATAAGVAAVQSDVDDIQTRLPAALVGGRIDSSVGAMAANTMTAAAAASDLTTELQAGLATAAALATVAGNAAAAKGVTDKLDTALELDGSVYRLTTNALEQAPTGGSAPTAAQNATAVRAELATELGRVDVAISTRLATSGYTAPPAAATVATAVRTELATELARIDVATGTRLATGSYTAPDNAGIATAVAGAAAIFARTDVATSTRAAPGAAMALTAAEREATADAWGDRNIGGGSNGGRTNRDAMRSGRNRKRIVGDTIEVYQEDDTTLAWTGVATKAPGDPLIEIDPA